MLYIKIKNIMMPTVFFFFQHSEFESIYRSFKKHQNRRAIEQAIMTGGLQKYYE